MAVASLPIHHLAVDGPIGVGKTTLVEMLAERFEGVKVLEDVSNPFLPAFYEDRPGAAFQTELYFLLSRYKQQQDIAQRDLFDKLYTLLEPQLTVPDLVLYLSADLETCVRRIDKRRRDFEKGMSEKYLAELIDAYNHYYHYYSRSPLLVVDTRKLDFVERGEDFEDLVRQLSEPIKGTRYYVPLGSR